MCAYAFYVVLSLGRDKSIKSKHMFHENVYASSHSSNQWRFFYYVLINIRKTLKLLVIKHVIIRDQIKTDVFLMSKFY